MIDEPTNYDLLTVEDAERMSDHVWQNLPKAVRNRIVQEYTGKSDLVPERSYPRCVENARKTHEKVRAKRALRQQQS